MRLAEVTSKDTYSAADTGWREAGRALESGVLEGAAGQFASVLTATRRSSKRLMELMASRSELGEERKESRSESIARSASEKPSPDESPQDRTQPADAAKPGRVDRLRSMQEESQGERPPRRVSQKSESEAAAGGVEQSAVATAPVPGQEFVTFTQTQTQPSELEGSAVAEPAVSAPAGMPNTTQTANSQSGVTAGTSASQVPEMPSLPGGGSAGIGGFTDPAALANGVQPVQPTSSASASQGDQGTSSTGNGGVQATARANAPAARASGSAGEFQQLLGQLARSRTGEPAATGPGVGRGMSAPKPADTPVDLRSSEAVSDLARIVRSRIGSRDSSMTLMMSPPELGRLRVDVRLEEDAVTVRFQADTLLGQEAIRSKLHELKAALEQQGVQIDRIEVESPASPAGRPERDADLQQQPHGQGQNPPSDGQSAGHAAGQAQESFEEQHQSAEDDGGEEPAAGSVAQRPELLGERDSGVDVMA